MAKGLFLKDNSHLLDIKDNEIERLREELKEARKKLAYSAIIVVFVAFWAFVATLAAIELGIHS